MKKWYLYIIETKKGKFYTGIATDVERRFLEHISGINGAKFFRSDPPNRLVYVEDCINRSDASIKESATKKLKRKEKEDLIKGAKSE